MVSPFASPFAPSFPQPYNTMPMGMPAAPQQMPAVPPEANLPRAINYLADYSGCGFWRLIWPGHLLCAHQKAVGIPTHRQLEFKDRPLVSRSSFLNFLKNSVVRWDSE